jgi:type I restriction enzyme, S subunit
MTISRPLGMHVELQRGTTYKSALLGRPGPVLLGLASIARDGGFRDDSLKTYGGESPEKLLLRPGDLYASLKDVTQSGDLLGAIARVPPAVNLGRLTQDTVKLTFVPRAAPALYVYWALRTPEYRQYCRARAIGTTNLSLAREDFLGFEIPEPNGVQLQLVELLDTIESKIALNKSLSKTLELTGRALFKSWFVDFDPIHARIRNNPALIEPAFAHLFPSELDKTQAPIGWTRRSLANWAEVASGGTPSKSNSSLWNGDIPWISPKVMTEIHADEADEYVTPAAIGKGTRLTPAGSTLVMVRGMGLHRHVRVSQARREVAFNQDVKALVPRGIQASLLLFALLDAQAELLDKVESSGHGTGKLPSEILLAHPITMPPSEVQALLTKPFDVINDRIGVAREETRTLAALRNLLLPKLLSGELRVRDVKRAMEAVA